MIQLKQLKTLREGKGLSQKELAKRAKISENTLQELEKCKRNPSLETILNLSKFFDIPVEGLINGKVEKKEVDFEKLLLLCQMHYGEKIRNNHIFSDMLKVITDFINSGKAWKN